MYSLFAKLGDGQFIFVASREGLDEALQLLKDLNEYWPNEYVIRDSTGKDVKGEESSQRLSGHSSPAALG